MISLDANILVYAVDLDAGEKHLIAKQLLTDAALAGNAALSEQILFEFLNVSIGKRRQPLSKAITVIERWTAVLPVIRANDDILEETIALLAQYKLSTWDARLVATCATHECDTLFSEDMQDGARYGAVRVIDPFKPTNAEQVRRGLAS